MKKGTITLLFGSLFKGIYVICLVLLGGCEKKQIQPEQKSPIAPPNLSINMQLRNIPPTPVKTIYHDSMYFNYAGYFPGYGYLTDSILQIYGSSGYYNVIISTTHKKAGKYLLGDYSTGNYLLVNFTAFKSTVPWSSISTSFDTATLYITSYDSAASKISGHFTGIHMVPGPFWGSFSKIPF